MVKRQVLCMLMLAAILAAVAVANVNAGPLHRRFAAIPAHVDIVTQADNGRDLEHRRRGAEHILAVVFFDENRAAKPQAHCPRDADGAQRLVRKV